MEPLLRTRRLSCPTHSKNNGVGLSIRNDVYMVCIYIYIYIDIYNTPYVSLYFYPKEKKGVDSFCPIRSFHTRLRFLFAPAWQCLLPRTRGWTKSKSASGGTNAPGSWDGYHIEKDISDDGICLLGNLAALFPISKNRNIICVAYATSSCILIFPLIGIENGSLNASIWFGC